MTTLATLVVKLVGDTTELSKSLDETNGIVERSTGRMGALGGVLKGGLVAGVGAAVVGVGALAAGLYDAVGEAMAAEEISAQLAAVLESTGGVAGVTADMATGLADSLSKVTRFEDDAILSGENLLLTFTNIGSDVFPTATETMLNMSQALGQDLKSSAVQLGKALNDPVQGMTALSRVGVSFTEEQKATIKALQESGDLMGAQGIILAELEREFGGAAVAAGQTFAGQLDIMKNSLGNVKEEVGMALLPALTTLAQTLGPILLQAAQGLANFVITNVVPALQSLFQWVATNLPPALQKLALFWTGTLQPALAQVWSFIQGSVIPILQQVFAWLATNLPPALQKLAQFWTGTLQPALETVWSFIQDSVVPILQRLFGWLAETIPAALATLSQFWTATLLPAIQAVWGFIETNLVPLFEALANLYIAGVRLALAALALIWEQVLKPALMALWEFLRDHIKGALVDVKAVLDGPLGTALRAFAALVEGAVGTALGIFEGALNGVIGAINGITSAIGTVIGWINTLKEKLSSLKLPSWLTPGSPTPLELGLLGIGQAMESVAQADIPNFGRGLGTLGSALDRLIDTISTTTPDAIQALADALGNVMQAIQTTLDAFAALAGFAGIGDLVTRLDMLGDHIQTLVAKFLELAELFAAPGSGIWSAKAVLDPLAEIFVNLQDVVEGFEALGRLDLDTLDVDAAVLALRDILPRLVRGLADAAATLDLEGLPAAVALAEAAGAIGAAMQAAIEGIEMALNYGSGSASFGTQGGYDGTDLLFERLRVFVAKLETVAENMDYQVFDAAVRLAQTAGAIGAAMKTAMEGMEMAMNYGSGPASFGTQGGYDGTDLLFERLRVFVAKLETVAENMDYQGFDAAMRLAAAAGAIGQHIQDAIDGILAAVEFRIGRVADGTDLFISQLQIFVNKLVDAGRLFDEAGLKGAVALAEAAGRIGKQVEDAIAGLTAVSKYAGLELVEGARLFAQDTATLLQELQGAALAFETAGLNAASDFVTAAGSIGSQIESAITGMKAIMDYTGGLAATAVQRLASDLAIMVDALREASGAFDQDALDAAEALASAAGQIGGSISETVEGLDAIMAYAGGLTQDAIARFVADLELMVRELEAVSFRFSDAGLASARRLAEAAGVIGDGVSSLADAMREIIDYTAPAPERIDEFAADMYTVIEKFRIVAAVLGEDGIEQAERFARAGAAIYQAIEDGIDSVLGISNSGPMGGVGDAMQAMVQQMVDGMAGMATQFDVMVDAAFDFGSDWVDGIMDGLNSRLGDLEELMAYIRGLFPSSPAKYGAWRDLPDGEAVGEAFTMAMAGALRSGSGSVAGALGGLRSAFDGGAGGGSGLAPVTINQTIHVNGGDPERVRDAAHLGLMDAARAVGLA